jgi:hypothetical protein
LVFFAVFVARFVFRFFVRLTRPLALFATYCASELSNPVFEPRLAFVPALGFVVAGCFAGVFAALFRRVAAIL